MSTYFSTDNFRKFLTQKDGWNLKEKSASSYVSNLKGASSCILTGLDSQKDFLSFLCERGNDNADPDAYSQEIDTYIHKIEIEKQNTSPDTPERKKYNNLLSALKAFRIFAGNSQKDSFVPVHDGMSPLIDKFGRNELIQYIISSCIFFSPEDNESHHREMVECISNRHPLPARFSSKREYYGKYITRGKQEVDFKTKGYESILVEIDGNGNAKVDQLIKKLTGHSLKGSANERPDIINYKMSHIWGNAIHPSYFTSLWNIVLVPLFANDILDKPSTCRSQSRFGAQLLNTLKAVISTLYNLDDVDWSQLRIEKPQIEKQYIVAGRYSINVFEHRDADERVDVKEMDITIS
ncbi:MAG: hypothetical protein K2H74_06465 [Paramuribaculum sp.]|nr:hypothetical protein [Paramuribaculum sp.]